ncbi:MAG: aspartate-alanine antiporter [Roseomonas sp.]|nr:aspartate-alanine antiporter [Roseomonas sp.]
MGFGDLVHFLEQHPDLAVFLVLGLGFFIGQFKFRGFGLGPVTGALFAGLFIGQFAEVPVSEVARSILFLLFLFGIGYSVGPKFLSAVKGDGLPGIAIGIIVPLTAMATAVIAARILGLDAGFAAGLFSGATTESPAIGTAAEAIRALPLPKEQRDQMISHIAVADALCYLFGALGVILMTTVIGPALLRIDVTEEARKLEEKYGITHKRAGIASAWRPVEIRAYAIEQGAALAGKTVAEAEASSGQRVFIQRIRRGDALMEPARDMILELGDTVALEARREVLIELLGPDLREVEDRELLDINAISLDVYVAGEAVIGRSIAELGDAPAARGVFLRRIMRSGLDVPISPATRLERGDIITLIGTEKNVEAAAAVAGAAIRQSDATDYVTLGLAIFAGGLIGTVVGVDIAGVHIALSTSVGTLMAGLFIGWVRSRRPQFARIPDAAIAMMTSLGLAAFVGMIGLHAGPVFVEAVREVGFGLLLAGACVTLVPQFLGLFIGRYVLRMNPLLLLGALSGAQTMTAALAALQEKSGSPIAVLGYTAAVPFGHILLTSGGTVMVWLMS